MADSVPVYIVPPPSKRKPWWAGIPAYIRYLGIGMAVLAGLAIWGAIVQWFHGVVQWFV